MRQFCYAYSHLLVDTYKHLLTEHINTVGKVYTVRYLYFIIDFLKLEFDLEKNAIFFLF